MTTFLYYVPALADFQRSGTDIEITANFETHHTIERLLDHICTFIPRMVGVNAGDSGWQNQLGTGRVFNYTYAFGLLSQSVSPTFVLEARQLDYVGARPAGIYLSANKPHASELMKSLGFLIPRQHVICSSISTQQSCALSRKFHGVEFLVIKPAYEESSIGLTVIENEPDKVHVAINRLQSRLPGVILVQEYIEGTDVTVPIFGRTDIRCFPAVALVHDTPRSEGPFVFDAGQKATKSTVHYESTSSWPIDTRRALYTMAEAAFRITQQRDYARLDCRVTSTGQCFFIEMNANPQLGLTKASIAVSAALAGMEVGTLISAILDDATSRIAPSPILAGL